MTLTNAGLPVDRHGYRIRALAPGQTENLSFGAASVQSAPIDAGGAPVAIVRIATNEPCRLAIGPDPTATASGFRIPAGKAEWLRISDGDRIAVIREEFDGLLSMSVMQ